jgi:hypothetical protein
VYDDTEASLPFNSVALSSSFHTGRDLSDFWVVDSACSNNLTACRGDLVSFEPCRVLLESAVSGLTSRAVALSDSPSLSCLVMLSTELFTHRLPPTSPLGLLNALDVSLVLVGCNHTTAACSFFQHIMTLAFSWFPQEWAC